MPAKSRKQQRYLYMKFGAAWVHAHHFDNKGLPTKGKKGTKRGKKSRRKAKA